MAAPIVSDNDPQRTPGDGGVPSGPVDDPMDTAGIWWRIGDLAGRLMTGPEGPARDLATLILHFDALMRDGWPPPPEWEEPGPPAAETVRVLGDLL